MKRRFLSLLIVVCIILTILTGCGGTNNNTNNETNTDTQKDTNTNTNQNINNNTNSSEAALPRELTFTYVTAPLNVPSIIEEEKDIFEDTFKKMGIDIEYAELTSGADQTQALASGDVQVLYAVGASSVILSAANGADIKILNMYSRSPKAFCMYSKDKGITSPKDLKGKKIAGPTGTNLHELLVAYLATENMTIDDVEYVNMTIPEAKAALDGGKLDVALLAGATAYQAKQQGHHMITDGEGLIDAIIVVAVTDKFYNDYPKVIEKLKQAQDKIAKYISNNKSEIIRIVADELDLEVSAVKEMYKHYDFSTKITEEDKKGIKKTADFMYKSGMIENELDINTLFYE